VRVFRSVASDTAMRRVLWGMLLVGLVQCAAYSWALRAPDGFSYGCYDHNCYLQAARRVIAGQAFSYANGLPVTTGQTSVAYPFVLAVPMALGAERVATNLAPFALAVVFYLVFLAGWGVVVARLFPPGVGRFAAAALVALSGQCAYVAFSQCDQGLWMAVSAAAAAAAVLGRGRLLLALLVLAPWVRPEGMMLAVSFAVVALPWPRAGLPVASVLGVFALNLALTGEAQFSSVAGKGYFKLYPFGLALWASLKDGLSLVSSFLCSVPVPLTRFFSLPSPVASVGFWIGLVVLARRLVRGVRCRASADARTAPCLAFVLAAALGVGSTSVGGFAGLDFDRYLAWAMPVPLLIAAWGVDWLSGRIRSDFWRKLPVVALVVTTLCGTAGMVLMMRQVACARGETFRELKRETRLLPPAARIGSEDFIWAYSLPADATYRELSGIFTPEFRGCTQFYAQGSEVLKQRPETRFDYWVAAQPAKVNQTSRRLAQRRNLYGTALDATASEPLLYRADWSAYDRAREPSVDRAGFRCVDVLDVGYGPHERASGRVSLGREVADYTYVRADAARATDGAPLVDAFVFVTAGESFTLTAEPGRDARLVLRTLGRVWFETAEGTDGCRDYGQTVRLAVSVDGRDLGTFAVPVAEKTFTDYAIPVSGEAIRSAHPRFTVRGDFASFGYWLYQ